VSLTLQLFTQPSILASTFMNELLELEERRLTRDSVLWMYAWIKGLGTACENIDTNFSTSFIIYFLLYTIFHLITVSIFVHTFVFFFFHCTKLYKWVLEIQFLEKCLHLMVLLIWDNTIILSESKYLHNVMTLSL